MKNNILALIGWVMVTGFSVFAIVAYPYSESKIEIPKAVYDIYNYTSYLGTAFIFLFLGKGEKNKTKRNTLFYSISIFYFIMFFNYIFNTFFDKMIDTHPHTIILIITTYLCLIYYLLSWRRY